LKPNQRLEAKSRLGKRIERTKEEQKGKEQGLENLKKFEKEKSDVSD